MMKENMQEIKEKLRSGDITLDDLNHLPLVTRMSLSLEMQQSTTREERRSSSAFDLDNMGSRMGELNKEQNDKDKAKAEQEVNNANAHIRGLQQRQEHLKVFGNKE